MFDFFRTAKSDSSATSRTAPKGTFAARGSVPSPRELLEKLRSYRDLAEEALERAYESDVNGDYETAKRRYKVGLQAIDEGLQLRVPHSGLGPQYDNAAKWEKDLNSWRQLAQDRLRDLNAQKGNFSDQPVKRITRQTSATTRAVLQNYNRNPIQPSGIAAKKVPQTAGKAQAAGKGDEKLKEVILSEVLDRRPSVRWEDVAGLARAKQALQEMVILPSLRADLFRGLRSPARGLLLYGPPGNGKTLLARALAHESKATFFNISASTLTSKWHGEAEKLVRILFATAAEYQPAIIFIDEIDSILSERSSGEHEASRRLKTQFLVEFDGVTQASNRIVVIGATNRPQELDDAVRRRLVKRIFVPMPDAESRRSLLSHTLQDQPCKLSRSDLEQVVDMTSGYSGSDLAALCQEAAMQPIRELGMRVSTVSADKVRPVNLKDFQAAMQTIRPSVSQGQLAAYEQWTKDFGTHA